MRLWIPVLLIVSVVPALAQAPVPQPFVPIVVTEQDVQQLQTYFHTSTPPAYSEPVLTWLNNLEQRAIAQDKAKKEAEKKPDTKQKP